MLQMLSDRGALRKAPRSVETESGHCAVAQHPGPAGA